MTSAGRGPTPDERITGPPAERPAPPRLPEFREAGLDNGLRIRACRREGLPEVALRLVIPAGADRDPGGAGGTASLTAALLTEGAAGRGAQDVAEWLDGMGAGLYASAGWDACVVAAHVLEEKLEDLLDLVAAIVLEPAFDPGEVERVRGERLDEIRRARDEPAEVATEILLRGVYGERPYGRPARGTEASVASLGAADLRRFWEERYGARGATMIAVGALDPGRLSEAVEARFGRWRAGSGPGPAPAAPGRPPSAGQVLLVDRPGSAQAELRAGAVGPARGHPDEIPALVGNAVIGGLFASRLNWELREERGWTYGVRSSFTPRRGPGPFVARTAVEPRYGVDALSIMRDQISGLARRPPGPEELDAARDTLTRGLPRQFETVSQVAARAADLAAGGLPDDWWTGFARRAATVDADEAARVAERYLGADDLVLSVVGDAEAMAGGLEGLGPVTVAEVP